MEISGEIAGALALERSLVGDDEAVVSNARFLVILRASLANLLNPIHM